MLNKRPRAIHRDKYALYDDVMKLKLSNNILICENVQLKTKVKRMEKELENKDSKIIGKIKRIEQKIHQSYQLENDPNKEKEQNVNQVPSLSSSVLTKQSNKVLQKENFRLEKISYQTNLTMALRRQINDLKEDVRVKDEELLNLKRDIRNTKYAEFETENNILMNEWVRLRAIIDQLFANMNKTPEGEHEGEENAPQNASPPRRDRSKDDMIQNLLQANEQFQKVDQEKDHRIMELQEIVQDLDDRLNKKNNSANDLKKNHAKVLKNKNKEIQKLKEQVETLSKETPGNKSVDQKSTAYKEAAAKAEKELARVKGDLKKYKEELQKTKAKMGEISEEKEDQVEENKELKRKINDLKTKLDLQKYKSKDDSSPAEPYQSHPKSPQPSLPLDLPQMKPIISDSHDQSNDFNFEGSDSFPYQQPSQTKPAIKQNKSKYAEFLFAIVIH